MRLKAVYIASLAALAVLVVFGVFRPMATTGQYSEVQRAHLLEGDDRWIIEFDIINHEEKDAGYSIEVVIGDEVYTEAVSIGAGRMFTYTHHIYRSQTSPGQVSFAVYRDGEPAPIERAIYFLR